MHFENSLVEMELREIQMIDNVAREQYIVLGEKGGEREFPIVIGYAEALALDLALHRAVSERPMTHDLVLNVARNLEATLRRVIVDKMENNIFHGKLELATPLGIRHVDTRPSDAIVLATKAEAPIFVAEQVLQTVLRLDGDED